LQDLVAIAKQRWIIERDYEELKQELGLGHYEGRGWRGFHHHATLCITAYGFLVAERSRFPPQRMSAISDYQRPNSRQNSTRAGRVRPERHNPSSIATLRIQISRQLLQQLSCYPFCDPRRL
jgi:Transposase DDE domain